VVEGFNGCVRKFIVNGHAYNIAATNIESVGKFNIRKYEIFKFLYQFSQYLV